MYAKFLRHSVTGCLLLSLILMPECSTDSSKSKSALCRGDIRKARLWLLERGGMGLQEEFQSILNELAEYQDEDIVSSNSLL